MTINEYQELAMRTNDGICNYRLFVASFDYEDNLNDQLKDLINPGELINGALGLTGEAGEVSDMIKKHIFHGHDLDRDDLIKELGDVCWYVALISRALGVNLEEVMSLNIEKLKNRYPEGFSEEASINRKA